MAFNLLPYANAINTIGNTVGQFVPDNDDVQFVPDNDVNPLELGSRRNASRQEIDRLVSDYALDRIRRGDVDLRNSDMFYTVGADSSALDYVLQTYPYLFRGEEEKWFKLLLDRESASGERENVRRVQAIGRAVSPAMSRRTLILFLFFAFTKPGGHEVARRLVDPNSSMFAAFFEEPADVPNFVRAFENNPGMTLEELDRRVEEELANL